MTAGAAALASSDFDYLSCPDDVDSTEMEEITDWLDDVRSKYCIDKLVLPEYAADNMAVVNFSASGIKVGAKTYTGAQYCSRIAGLLAGTPLSNSATSAPLDEAGALEALLAHLGLTEADGDGFVPLGLSGDGAAWRFQAADGAVYAVPLDGGEITRETQS